MLVAQLYLTLWDRMDCNPSGSSVHGILQARILSGLPFPSPSRGTEFISFVSKITVDGDCSHEIKRCLLLGRKAMTNLDSILKSRDITLPMKAHLVRGMAFPVVMYVCKSWTMKKAEH